jgi:hypothetical protein
MAIGIGTAVAAAAPEIMAAVEGAGAAAEGVGAAAEGAGAAAGGGGGGMNFLKDAAGSMVENMSGGQFGGGSNPLKGGGLLTQSSFKGNFVQPTDTSKSPGSDSSTEIL